MNSRKKPFPTNSAHKWGHPQSSECTRKNANPLQFHNGKYILGHFCQAFYNLKQKWFPLLLMRPIVALLLFYKNFNIQINITFKSIFISPKTVSETSLLVLQFYGVRQFCTFWSSVVKLQLIGVLGTYVSEILHGVLTNKNIKIP